jgi:hypothetical protein
MPNYQDLKARLVEHRQKVLYAVCAVLVFLVGFGTGRAQLGKGTGSTQLQYTAKAPQNQVSSKETDAAQGTPQVAASEDVVQSPAKTPDASAKTGDCLIKGTSSKIYHMKGGQFYNRITKPVACFGTEEEARAAGYRKSSR